MELSLWCDTFTKLATQYTPAHHVTTKGTEIISNKNLNLKMICMSNLSLRVCNMAFIFMKSCFGKVFLSKSALVPMISHIYYTRR